MDNYAYESREEYEEMNVKVKEFLDSYIVLRTLSSDERQLKLNRRNYGYYAKWTVYPYEPNYFLIAIESNLYKPRLSLYINKQYTKYMTHDDMRWLNKWGFEEHPSSFEFGINTVEEVNEILIYMDRWLFV